MGGRAVALSVVLGVLLYPGMAGAENVLGIPCTTQPDRTRACIGDTQHRVPTWDGVPLDVDVFLPPADQDGPFPAIFALHGFGQSKGGSDLEMARQGYVLVQYSARGFGNSCGTAPSRDDPACVKGWSHLADIRYEPRDTQYLAGLLADAGLVDGQRIGVTGTSYGAGQSLMLATLKDRVAMPDYKLVPWRSPQGKPMRIAAAAPNWAWADLASMLVPNGRGLDYSTDNDYGTDIGTPKMSYVGLLFAAGGGAGYFAPPSVDFASDADGWVSHFSLGDPYDDYDRAVIDEIVRHHSPYTIEDGVPAADREPPAPIFDNTSWTDDLLPPTEMLRYRNRVLSRYPGAEYDLLLSDGAGHPRAGLTGTTQGVQALQRAFFDRLLKGTPGTPLGIRTYTQACGGSTLSGPFDTTSWAAQHPGEVRFADAAARTITSKSDDATSARVDPVADAASSCVTMPAVDSPLAATYRLPAATGSGYTIMGSPTVVAQIAATAPSSQVNARLWDVGPDGQQAFITRVAYRPRINDTRPQVFQLHPNGWQVAAGHVIKLQLVGEDQPYVRQSNSPFAETISNLQLRLPVREVPGGQVLVPAPFLDRDAAPLAPAKLAPDERPRVTTTRHRGCVHKRRIVIRVRGLRHAIVRVGRRRIRVRHGRAVIHLPRRSRRVIHVKISGVSRTGRHVRRTRSFRTCRDAPEHS